MQQKYRVFKVHCDEHHIDHYEIHAVQYDEKHPTEIFSVTLDPWTPIGDSFEELKNDIAAMKEALSLPIIDGKDYFFEGSEDVIAIDENSIHDSKDTISLSELKRDLSLKETNLLDDFIDQFSKQFPDKQIRFNKQFRDLLRERAAEQPPSNE